MPNQLKELDRVKSRIGFHVLRFIRTRWFQGNPTFYMRELHDYIKQQTSIAPASPDRVMRALRQDGYFDYEVIDRRASQYEITDVTTGRRSPPLPRKVKVKVWRVTWQDGDTDVYFTEEETRRVNSLTLSSDVRHCTVTEEIVEAIRA